MGVEIVWYFVYFLTIYGRAEGVKMELVYPTMLECETKRVEMVNRKVAGDWSIRSVGDQCYPRPVMTGL